jgi:DNA-binding NarL/FixJ family response regulator
MVGEKKGDRGSPVDRLTDRELQVLEYIGRGLGTRQIAEKLGLSIKTIENYREHLKSKLELKNAAELVRYAVRWELEGQG